VLRSVGQVDSNASAAAVEPEGRRRIGLLVVGLAAVALLLAGCGGGGGSSAPKADAWKSLPFKPNQVVNNGDPDSEAEGGSDGITTVSSLGNNRFQVTVQNDSALGTINAFTWVPPHGLRITAVTSSSTGSCRLDSGNIVCRATLTAPKCTCVPGGEITIRFKGVTPTVTSTLGGTKHLVTTGLQYGSLRVDSVTPVPYIIPTSPSEPTPATADLPFCPRGQHSTSARRCIETGAAGR
jgi:hypothetical protein